MARKSLRQELGKKKPFESPEKEAILNIARTSDRFQNRFARLFREFGLTGSQHNLLVSSGAKAAGCGVTRSVNT